jgi:hypothetical protein
MSSTLWPAPVQRLYWDARFLMSQMPSNGRPLEEEEVHSHETTSESQMETGHPEFYDLDLASSSSKTGNHGSEVSAMVPKPISSYSISLKWVT